MRPPATPLLVLAVAAPIHPSPAGAAPTRRAAGSAGAVRQAGPAVGEPFLR